MKAILYHSYGDPGVLELGELVMPVPGRGEVLVQVEATALNPIDAEIRKGSFKQFSGKRFPRVPGCDFAGNIVAVGPSVRDFRIGDEVYGMNKTFKGRAHAEFIVMKIPEIGLKPAALSMEEAAALPLAALTALQALRDLARLKADQKVLLNGASGGVGVFAIQIAKAMHAEVVAICSYRNRELVQSLGADRHVDYKQTNPRDITEKFDVVFDIYGSLSFPRSKHLLHSGGRHVTTIPSLKNFRRQFFSMLSARKTKVVTVVSRTRDLNHLRQMVEREELRSVLDRVLPLEAATDAYTYLETRRARGKVVLVVERT